ncbi:hypothetical protein K438DRAFT_1873076, partial [Mycena galopus ATCC 62051]
NGDVLKNIKWQLVDSTPPQHKMNGGVLKTTTLFSWFCWLISGFGGLTNRDILKHQLIWVWILLFTFLFSDLV